MKKFISFLLAVVLCIGVLHTSLPGDGIITVTAAGENTSAVTGVSFESESLSVIKGEAVALTAVIAPEDAANKAVSWASDNEQFVTVDENGNVYGVAVGEANVTATTLDGGFTATCRITVIPVPVTGVSFAESIYYVDSGHDIKLTATVLPENAANKSITWASSNSDVARVDESGNVHGICAGKVTITVTTVDGGYTASCTLQVIRHPFGVDIASRYNQDVIKSLTIKVGESYQFRYQIHPADSTNTSVTWSSSAPDIVSITSGGYIKALAKGESIITITTVDGGYTATCKVTVTQPLNGIGLEESEINVVMGNTASLNVTFNPENASNQSVSWASSDETVATVENGVVTPVSPGSATITVTSSEGKYTAKCNVTVQAAVASITYWDTEEGRQVYFAGLSDAIDAATEDDYSIALCGNTTENIVIDKQVEIDLNGFVLCGTGEGSVVTIEDGGTVWFLDSDSEAAHYFTENNGLWVWDDNAENPVHTVYGGIITGGNAVYGGGIYNCGMCGNLGGYTINIVGNNATYGGGVYNVNDFELEGGCICGNTASYGAGIYASEYPGDTYSTFTGLSGEFTIADNKASVSGGGIYTRCDLDIAEDTLIRNNTAQKGGGVYTCGEAEIYFWIQHSVQIKENTGGNLYLEKNAVIRFGDMWVGCEVYLTMENGAGVFTSSETPCSEEYFDYIFSDSDDFNVICSEECLELVYAVKGISLGDTEIYIIEGQSRLLTANILPAAAYNKDIIWWTEDENIATVGDAGLITGVAVGTTEIMAVTMEGDYSATCTVNVVPAVTGVELPTEAVVTRGSSSTIKATISPEDAYNKNLTWESDNTSVATVDASGKVTGVSLGTATITVTTDDGGFTSSCTVTVVRPVTTVTLNKHSHYMKLGSGGYGFSVTVAPYDALDKSVIWSSSDSSVVAIDQNGFATAVSSGSATITVTSTESGKSDSCTIEVLVQPVSGVTLDKQSAAIEIGGTLALTATVAPNDASYKDVKWSSSNTSVATVDANGNVKAIGIGSAVITVTTVSRNKTATCKITVVRSVTGITLDRESTNLGVGEALTLNAIISPADATDMGVVWTSDNEAVATVENGVVTAHSVGNAIITVTANDGGYTASCNITAYVPVTGVALSSDNVKIKWGEGATLTATVLPENATNKNLSWASDNEAVVTVENGVITVHSVGKATITVTTEDGGYTASAAVTIQDYVAKIYNDGFTYYYTVSEAIASASNGDTITMIGNSTEDISVETGKSITLDLNGYVLKGTGNGSVVTVCNGATLIIYGNNADRKHYFNVNDDGLWVWDENDTDNGGNLISGGIITGGNAEKGGGIYNCGTLVNYNIGAISVVGNNATYGGGIYTDNTLEMNGSVKGNTAEYGGGVYNASSNTVYFSNSLSISDNIATIEGGGMYNNGTMSLSNNVSITENNAPKGGGIYATASVTIRQSVTVTGNSSDEGKSNLYLANGAKLAVWEPQNYFVGVTLENGTGTVNDFSGVYSEDSLDHIIPDNSDYNAVYTAYGYIEFVCPAQGITVDSQSLTIPVGSYAAVNATVLPEKASNKGVSWSSDNESVATVSGGYVWAIAPGEAIITATSSDGGFTALCHITVTVPVSGITLSSSEISLDGGTSATLTATVEPEDAGNKNVIWSSSNEAVATVENGVVTAHSVGKALITAASEEGGYTASAVVTVRGYVATAYSNGFHYYYSVSEAIASVENGTTITMIADSDEDLTIESGKSVILDLNGCVLKGTGNGSVITVCKGASLMIYGNNTDKEHNFYFDEDMLKWDETNSVPDYNRFTMTGGFIIGGNAEKGGGVYNCGTFVNYNIGMITVAGNRATYGGGIYNEGTFEFYGAVTDNIAEYGGGLYNASGEAVNTFFNGGAGYNTATVAGGGIYNGGTLSLNGEASICENYAPVGAGVYAAASIKVWDSVCINDNYAEEGASNLYLASGTDVTVWNPGDYLIGVTLENGTGTFTNFNGVYNDESVEHFIPDNPDCETIYYNGYLQLVCPVTGLELDVDSVELAIGNSIVINAAVLPENATNKGVSWTSDNEAVATVLGGVVTAVSEGCATITATTTDGGYTASCTINAFVQPVTGITISRNSILTVAGNTEELTATISPADATIKHIIWSSSNYDVANVENGVITAIGAGEAVITAISVDGNFSAECTVTVLEAEACIWETYYASLAEAFEAADDYDTVTLCKDIFYGIEIKSGEHIYLNLNGHVLACQATGSVIKVDKDAYLNLEGGESETAHYFKKDKYGFCEMCGEGDGYDFITYGGVITGGYNEEAGGGIYNLGELELSNVNIVGNIGANGGGIYNEGTVYTNFCSITNNIAVNGGGIFNCGMCSVSGGKTSDNSATDVGGGIYNCSLLALLDTDIQNNSAGIGGGVYHTLNPDQEAWTDLEMPPQCLDIGGSVNINGNKCDGVVTNNVCLTDGLTMDIYWFGEDDYTIGVYIPFGDDGRFIGTADGLNEETAEHFFSDASSVKIKYTEIESEEYTESYLELIYCVEEIYLNTDEVTINPGCTYQLSYEIYPEEAVDQSVIWTSDNEAVATVENGLITAIASGYATITVTTNDGGYTATCIVTVEIVSVENVTLSINEITLKEGETATLTATILPENATEQGIIWYSDNENVVTVDNGVLTAVAPGVARITVTTIDGGLCATCVVIVATPVSGVTLNESELTIKQGEAATLTVTVSPEDATEQGIIWTSGNEAVATVENGVITAVAPGATTITVTTIDGSYTATCVVTVTVPVSGVTLSSNEITLIEGEAATLTATVSPEDATEQGIIWTSGNEAVATVENGVITAVAPGATTITVTTIDGGYTATCTVTVEANEHGDVNGDGVVNDDDLLLLTHFLAGWDNVTIDTDNADVNSDGKVTLRDRAYLARYLAGWEGYDTYFK